MKELKGRVAVVTGAASGIGLAMAHRFADEGMKVVLSDIEIGPLREVEQALRAKGADAIAVHADVMSQADVQKLADAAYTAFEKVHVLCNNAGVATPTSLRAAWEAPHSDWEWVMGVNFMGVLYGIREFVPRMLAGGDEGHIVNTASVAGLLTSGNPYGASKHAVVCLTEGIYKDFRKMGAKLSASALCPGWIRTRIQEAERNRPARFGPPTDRTKLAPDVLKLGEAFRNFINAGLEPSEVANDVVDAIREDRFYVVPAQPWIVDMIQTRLQDITQQRNPTLPPPM